MKYLFFFTMVLYSTSVSATPYYDNQYDIMDFQYTQTSALTGSGLAATNEWLFVGVPGYDKVQIRPLPTLVDVGAVHVYRKNFSTGEWNYFQRILPHSSVDAYSYFGSSIDASGTKVIIGAPGGRSGAGFSGLYSFNGTSWVLSQQIEPSGLASLDNFGFSVAIQGNCIAIGTPGRDGYSGTNTGAVYLYKYVNNVLTLINTSTPPAIQYYYPYYGYSVDVVDRYWDNPATCSVVVGAPNAVVNGNLFAGFIKSYKINYSSTPYTLTLTGYFTGQAGDEFGRSVSMIEYSGTNTYDRIFIGSPGYANDEGKISGLRKSTSNLWSTCTTPCLISETINSSNGRYGEKVNFNSEIGLVSEPEYGNFGRVHVLVRHNCWNQSPFVENCFVPLDTINSPNLQTNEVFGGNISVDYTNTPASNYLGENDYLTLFVSSPKYDYLSYTDNGIAYQFGGTLELLPLWQCTNCGYLHSGELPPFTCPVCMEDSTFFTELDEWFPFVF